MKIEITGVKSNKITVSSILSQFEEYVYNGYDVEFLINNTIICKATSYKPFISVEETEKELREMILK